MESDCLRKNDDFSASSEPIFKIPDAMCRKIDTLSIFGALIDQTFAPHGPQPPPVVIWLLGQNNDKVFIYYKKTKLYPVGFEPTSMPLRVDT